MYAKLYLAIRHRWYSGWVYFFLCILGEMGFWFLWKCSFTMSYNINNATILPCHINVFIHLCSDSNIDLKSYYECWSASMHNQIVCGRKGQVGWGGGVFRPSDLCEFDKCALPWRAILGWRAELVWSPPGRKGNPEPEFWNESSIASDHREVL